MTLPDALLRHYNNVGDW